MTAAPKTGRREDLELRAAVVLEALRRGLLADRVVDLLIERARRAAARLDLILDERVAILRELGDLALQVLALDVRAGHDDLLLRARQGRDRRRQLGRGHRFERDTAARDVVDEVAAAE